MSFCLYELCLNQIVQDKLRDEILNVFDKYGELTYSALNNMPYVDIVIRETLRNYPPMLVLDRICTRSYKIPGADLFLEKNTQIIIPIKGIHYDEELYPNPEKFDPERFSEEEKGKRNPFALLSFEEGPRICVGMRFGLLQTNVGLSLLLKNYRFKVNSQTSAPLVFDKSQFLTTALAGVFVDLETIVQK